MPKNIVAYSNNGFISEYGNYLWFLKIDKNSPDIVVSAEGAKSHTNLKDDKAIVKQAAMHLKDNIEMYAANIFQQELPWPPNNETLTQQETEFPSSVTAFFTEILKLKDHMPSESIKRLIQSYASDLIHCVTRGKGITLKHFLLGMGLHNLT